MTTCFTTLRLHCYDIAMTSRWLQTTSTRPWPRLLPSAGIELAPTYQEWPSQHSKSAQRNQLQEMVKTSKSSKWSKFCWSSQIEILTIPVWCLHCNTTAELRQRWKGRFLEFGIPAVWNLWQPQLNLSSTSHRKKGKKSMQTDLEKLDQIGSLATDLAMKLITCGWSGRSLVGQINRAN